MKNKKAFTLVELLIVVGIIGVLAGLLFPVIGKIAGTGPKVTSANSGKNIAQSWLSYAKAGQKTFIVSAPTAHEWAAVLAEKNDLNTPELWILSSDPLVMEKLGQGNVAMPIVVSNKIGANWQLNPEFKAFPLSWSIANKTLPSATSAMPLIWSRGLLPTGLWSEDKGVFGTEGGHIAFADGRVVWYNSLRDENTNQGILRAYNSTQRTFNIAQTIRGGTANVLNP